MSKPARTLKLFAVYLFATGLVLMLAPNLLLTTFGLPATQEVWIRVIGVVMVNLGAYYWYAAVSDARLFFVASVYTRSFVLVAFIAFVLLDYVKPMLILFGAIDFVGGLWTWAALRAEPTRAPAA